MVGPNLPFGGLACGLVLGPLPSIPLGQLDLVEGNIFCKFCWGSSAVDEGG